MTNWEMRFLGGKNNLSVAADRYKESKIKDIKSEIKGNWAYIETGGPNKKLKKMKKLPILEDKLLLSTMQVHL